MNGCIGRNVAGLSLGRPGPAPFDEYGHESPIFESEPLDDHGRESPVATPRTPRPGEGHGDEQADHGEVVPVIVAYTAGLIGVTQYANAGSVAPVNGLGAAGEPRFLRNDGRTQHDWEVYRPRTDGARTLTERRVARDGRAYAR